MASDASFLPAHRLNGVLKGNPGRLFSHATKIENSGPFSGAIEKEVLRRTHGMGVQTGCYERPE